MTTTNPMSDIGRALTGVNGEKALKDFQAFIDNEQAKLKTSMRQGLSKQDYDLASMKLRAWDSARLILKSIHLYHKA